MMSDEFLNKVIAPPVCVTHNIEMNLLKIVQGDGKDEIYLGCFYSCSLYDATSDNPCEGVVDADGDGNPIYEDK